MYSITPGSRENGVVKTSLGFNTITHRPLKFRVFEGPVGSLVMPKDGLVFYAPLRENEVIATEQSISTSGTVIYTTQQNIPCCYLNNSYIYGSDSIISGDSPFSISVWAKANDTSPIKWIICLGSAGTNNAALLGIRYSNQFGFMFYANDDSDSGISVDMSWHHFLITYNGSVGTTYIDGMKKREFSFGAVNVQSSWRIGAVSWANENWNGYISSARIYNRVLTTDEITLLSREFDNAFLVFDMDAKKGLQDNSSNPCTLENHGVTTSNDCFVFDGSSYITTNQASKLNLGTGDFTIEIVMNLSTGNSSKNYPTLIGGKDGWNSGANGIRWNGTHHRNGFAVFLNPSDPLMRSNTTFTPNDNTFITYVLQRNAGVWSQYFDGVKDSTTVNDSREYDLSHSSGMSIGCSTWDGANGYHVGLIKSVKIWNKARYQ